MHDTARTLLPRRVRAALAAGAAAALTLTLVPGAAAQEAAAERRISVRLKVATAPAVEVTAVPRSWPTRLVESRGVSVDGNDLVAVVRDGRRVAGRAKRVRQGDTVRVVDVEKHRRSREKRIRPGIVEVPTTELAPGRRKVVREGRPGVRRITTVRTLHNGEPVSYRVVAAKTIRDPRARRVLVGRRASSVPGADGLNWAALARCESGGNPRAVNPAGYYGLYQFNVATWRSVGGSGMPHHASAGAQTFRAKLLYRSRGSSPWPHCGRLL